MRALELFSGAGGLAIGLERAKFQNVAFVEFNSHACNSLRANFSKSSVIESDVRKIDFKQFSEIDLIAGGPPCQPFSLGGKHNAKDDSRDMFPHAIRAISDLQPKGFIFENVKGLLRPSFAKYFEYIIHRLKFPNEYIKNGEDWSSHLARLKAIKWDSYIGTKYSVEFKVLNSADFGVPQKRERVFIVGLRSDVNYSWTFPIGEYSKIRLEWDKFVSGDYWVRHKLPQLKNQSKRELLLDKFGLFEPEGKPWQTIRDALGDVTDPRLKHQIQDHEYRAGARQYTGHTGSPIDEPSKTIKAGVHGVPGGENMILFPDGTVRYLTTYEAKIIQTFPKNFQITGGWGESLRQIGNAVPADLAEIIAKRMGEALRLGNQSAAD